MRSLLNSFIFFVALTSLFGCGGSKSLTTTDTGEVPEWFITIPQDPNYLFAARTATSRDLSLAVDKAVTNARAEIGRQVQVKVEALQKSMQEEVGGADDAQLIEMITQVTKIVVSTTLSGSKVKHQIHVRDGDAYRAYVLVEYPIGATNQAFMQALKNNEQMYTRFRSSETFKELDEEVKKYEAWKKEQANKMR